MRTIITLIATGFIILVIFGFVFNPFNLLIDTLDDEMDRTLEGQEKTYAKNTINELPVLMGRVMVLAFVGVIIGFITYSLRKEPERFRWEEQYR